LSNNILGPLGVKQINNVFFRLALPSSIKIHPVFHVFLLEPYHKSTIPGRTFLPPPPIEIDNNSEYEVEKILDSKIRWHHSEYLVLWKGYDLSECTWELVSNLQNAPNKIATFHRTYPHKPRIVHCGTHR
jgi:hypothetical protein